MPRSGSGVYSVPAGTPGTPNTNIESAKYNAFVADIAADQNTPRPIVAGGTGASTALAALTSLGAQPLKATLTSIGALGTAADKLLYTTALNTFAETDLSAHIRTNILPAADGNALWAAIGLGTVAGQDFTDNDDLSVDPGNVGTRGNMESAIAAQALGAGQTMQDMSASRSVNTIYTNDTGRAIWVSVGLTGNYNQSLEVDGVKVSSVPNTTAVDTQMSAIVPAGSTYEAVGSSAGISYWAELR